MANRYWVGGDGTWDTTSTTNWSTTSGTGSGASVPTSGDSVFFDQAGTYTVTMTGALNCLDITVSAGTVTFATGTTPTLAVAGSASIIAGTVWNSTGTVTFTATTSKTVNTNGITFDCPMTFNGTGGTWTLSSNLTLGTIRTATLTAGTLALGSYTLTTGLFSASGSTTRTLNFGTGKIALNGSATATVWTTSTTTGLTVSGTPLVECSGGGAGVTKTITPGSLSEANSISFSLLETTGTVTYSITAGSLRNLTINGSQTVSNTALTIYGNYAHDTTNGTTTFTAGTSAWTFAATSSKTITAGSVTHNFPWTFNGTGGTWTLSSNLTLGTARTATLTAGTLALGSYTLTTGLFSASGSTTRTLNFGTGKIALNGSATATVWTTSTTTGLTVSGTPLVECSGGGAGVTKTISVGSLSEANSISFSLLETTGTVTYAFTASDSIRDLTVNGVQTVTNRAFTIYGNYTHSTTNGTTTFTAGSNAWTFGATSGTKTISASPTTHDFPMTINGVGGTFQLSGNLTLGATRQLTLTNGTFDQNSNTITAAGITMVTGTVTANNINTTLPITHTSGTLNLGTAATVGTYTHSAGTLNFANLTLTATSLTSSSGTRTLTFGTTGQISLTGSNATVLSLAEASLTVSGTLSIVSTYAGSTGTRTFAMGTWAESTALNVSAGAISPGVSIGTGATDTVTITGSIKNLDLTGMAFTYQSGTSTVYGNLTVPASGGTVAASTGVLTFGGSGSKNIINNSRTLDFPITFNGANGTWALTSNLTTGSSRTTTLTNGTLALGSYTLTTGLFDSSGVNARTLNFGTGKIVLNNNATNTIWSTYLTGLTVSGTPLVECSGGGAGVTKTISVGSLSEANSISFSLLETTGTVTYAFTASDSIRDLTVNGVQTVTNRAFTIYGNYTHSTTNGTTTFTAGSNAWTFNASSQKTISTGTVTHNFPWILSGNYLIQTNLSFTGQGNQLTIDSGTVDFNNKTLTGVSSFVKSSNTATVVIKNLTTTATVTHYGGTVTLGTDVTTGSYTLISGSLQLQSYALTCWTFNSSTQGNTRNIYFGTGKIVINNNLTATVWNTSAYGISIFNADTGYVELTGGGVGVTKSIYVDRNASSNSIRTSVSFKFLETTGSVTYNFSNSSSYIYNLIFNGTQTVTWTTLYIDGNYTYDPTGGTTTLTGSQMVFGNPYWQTGGTFNITTNGLIHDSSVEINRLNNVGTNILQDSLTLGASRSFTMTSGTFNFNNFNLTANSFSSTGTYSTLAFGSSGKMFVTGGNTTIISLGSSNMSTTGTVYIKSTYTGGVGTRVIDNRSLGNLTSPAGSNGIIFGTEATDTISLTGIYYNLDLTGLTNTLSNTTRSITGNLTIPTVTGTITGGTNATSFDGAHGATQLIDVTPTLDFPITLSAYSDTTYVLQRPLSLTTARTLNLSIGTFDLNNFTATTGSFVSSTINTRSIAFGTQGQITMTGAGTVLSMSGASGFSYTGTLRFFANSSVSSTKGFNVGSTANLTDPSTAFNVQFVNYSDTSVPPGLSIGNSTVSQTVTLSGSYNDVDFTNFVNTLSNSLSNFRIYGNLTVPASGGVSYGTGTWNLIPLTGTTRTVSLNGRSIGATLVVGDGTNTGTAQLSSNGTVTTQLTLSSGTLDLNNQTFTALSFSSNNTVSRSLGFGSTGQLTLTVSSSGSNPYVWSTNNATNFTTSGTVRIFASNPSGSTGNLQVDLGGNVAIPESAAFDVGFGSTVQSNSLTINIPAGSTSGFNISGGINNLNLSAATSSNNIGLVTETANVRVIYGNVTLSGSTVSLAGNLTFTSSTKIQTLTTNGTSVPVPVYVNKPGQALQIVGAATITDALHLTTGSIDLNNYVLTATYFESNNTNTRSLSFGSTGQMVLTSADSDNATIDIATATNFSYTGNSYILATRNGTRIFNLGNINAFDPAYVFDFSTQDQSSSGIIITNQAQSVSILGQVKNLDLRNNTNTIIATARQIYGNIYIDPASGVISSDASNITTLSATSGNYTVDVGNRALDFPIAVNSTGTYTFSNSLICGSSITASTKTFTLTSGNIVLNGYALYCGQFSSNNTNTRAIDFTVSNSQIQLLNSNVTIWDTSVGTNLTLSSGLWVDSKYTGSTGTRTINLGTVSESVAPNVKVATGSIGFNLGTATDTVALSGSMCDLNLTSFVGTLFNAARTVYGNLTVPASGGTLTAGTLATTLASTSATTRIIQTNNRSITFPITINGINGSWQFQSNLTLTSSYALTLSNGTVDFNNKTISSGTNIAASAGNIIIQNLSTTLALTQSSGSLTLATNIITGGFTFSAGNLYIGSYTITTPDFSSSSGSVRNLDFGTGKIVLNATTQRTIWSSDSTNLTIGGSRTVESAGGGTGITKTISAGSDEATSVDFSLLETTGSVTYVVNGARDLTLNGTQTLGGSQAYIYGSFNHSAANGTTTITTSGNFRFLGSSGTKTIATQPITYNVGWYFNAEGATYQIQNNITVGSTYQLSLYGGNIQLGSTTFTIGSFYSSGSSIRSIEFGTGKMVLNYANTGTIWTNSGSNFYVSGSRLVECKGGGTSVTKTLSTVNSESTVVDFSLLETTGSVTYTLGHVRNLTINGNTTINNTAITVYGNYTHSTANGTTTFTAGTNIWTFAGTSGTKTISAGSVTHDFPWTFNGVGSTWQFSTNISLGSSRIWRLDNGTVDFNSKTIAGTYISIQNGSVVVQNLSTTLTASQASGTLTLGTNTTTGAYTLTGGNLTLGSYALTVPAFNSSINSARTINFSTGKIVLNATTTSTIWDTSTTTGMQVSGTSLVECSGGGSSVTKTISAGSPAQSIAMNFSLLESSGTATYSFGTSKINNLTINGSQTVSNTGLTIYGNYTYSTSRGYTTTFTAGSTAWIFGATSGTQEITSTAITYDFPWTFDGVGGTFRLQSAITIGSTRTLTLTNGTADLNGYTFTSGSFSTTTGTKSIIFNGGTIALTASGSTVWNNGNPTGLTISKGSANGTISLTSSSAKTFVGGGSDYSGAVLNQGGTGNLTITGTNTIEDLSATISTTANSRIIFSNGVTTTFNKFTLTGTSSYQPTLSSVTSGTTASLYSPTAVNGFVNGANYIKVQDIIFTPFPADGTDYIHWHIGANSTILTGTKGALAQTYLAGATPKVYVLETGTTWTVPRDFNTTNNIVHLIGAGGSGNSGAAGGQGGGGGGYTRVVNINLQESRTVTYSVPIPSSGITANATVFSTFTANSGGAASGISASVNNPVGAGGIGETYNGGAGGAIATAGAGGNTIGGAGGGGAGGPQGNGATGGLGLWTSSTDIGGAGGGGAGGGTVGANVTASTTGGIGGNNYLGTGGGAAGTASSDAVIGTQGGGGGGGGSSSTASSRLGAQGGQGADILKSLGAGGGGGGGARWSTSGAAGAKGGLYGGGGGGGSNNNGNVGAGGAGAQGVIIIQYLPVTPKFMGFFG